MSSNYPDPGQLRAFADDPALFLDILPKDVEINENGVIEGSYENISVRFVPTYVLVETREREWVHSSKVSWSSIDHTEAWEKADNVVIQDDFISATGIDPDSQEPAQSDNYELSAQFDAYWVLDELTVKNPNLRR